ncbi:MAG: sterol desaturase family protein [Hyphomicrobiaceae bacterium]|nr:sterol desaturase family protein [Hyphomicrobiaceae bacterium]
MNDASNILGDSPYSIVIRNPELLTAFLLLVACEIVWRKFVREEEYGAAEAAASVGIAIGRAVAKPVMIFVLAGLYVLVYQWRIFTFDMTKWWSWVLVFLGADFLYYWMHRFKHEIRWMWADHAVHHSGNRMNVFMNFRLGWTGLIVGTWLMHLPLVLVGFPPSAVITTYALSLVWQAWIHTDMIGKLPQPFEWILNTPSHHRVHHSRNPVYLDKNYAGILIVWDRMFGTFQEELEDEPCDYGLVHRLTSVNPLKIAFNEWGNLIHDVRNAKTWRERFRAAFGYPGDKKAVIEAQARIMAEREKKAKAKAAEQSRVARSHAAAE